MHPLAASDFFILIDKHRHMPARQIPARHLFVDSKRVTILLSTKEKTNGRCEQRLRTTLRNIGRLFALQTYGYHKCSLTHMVTTNVLLRAKEKPPHSESVRGGIHHCIFFCRIFTREHLCGDARFFSVISSLRRTKCVKKMQTFCLYIFNIFCERGFDHHYQKMYQ
jgi:hypothetical protein